MKKVVDILITEMIVGKKSITIKNITVDPWDKNSFELNDNVTFRIMLQQDNNIKDVTSCYIIHAKATNNGPSTNSTITYSKVLVEYSRRTEMKFTKEK